eukprot:3314729-Rhodomonas_salina.1
MTRGPQRASLPPCPLILIEIISIPFHCHLFAPPSPVFLATPSIFSPALSISSCSLSPSFCPSFLVTFYESSVRQPFPPVLGVHIFFTIPTFTRCGSLMDGGSMFRLATATTRTWAPATRSAATAPES